MRAALSEKTWILRGVHWGNCSSRAAMEVAHPKAIKPQKAISPPLEAGYKYEYAIDLDSSPLTKGQITPTPG